MTAWLVPTARATSWGALALVGLAVGIERQRSGRATGPGQHFAGTRTFLLIGLLGGLGGLFVAHDVALVGTALIAGGARQVEHERSHLHAARRADGLCRRLERTRIAIDQDHAKEIAAMPAATNATSRFPADAPVRECLVRFGEATPAGSFGSYRLWVSQRNVSRRIASVVTSASVKSSPATGTVGRGCSVCCVRASPRDGCLR